MKFTTLFLFNIVFIAGVIAQTGRNEIDQEVYVGEDTITGTLLTHYDIGSKKFKKEKVIIFIPGSGPTDRNGNSAFLGGANDTYKQLADSLLALGVASYRYDKLGVGKSSMRGDEEDLRFSSNIEVVDAIYDRLREIGYKKIYLLGHSEGSMIGMIAAQSRDVKGYISVAGPGRSFYTIIEEQLSKQLPEEMLTMVMQKLDSIKQGHLVTTYPPMLGSLLRESVQPYLKELLNVEPTTEIAKLDCPVMIIQGEEDLQITEEDSKALSEAKPDALYKLYPEMNHVLKLVKSEEENKASYTDPDFRLYPGLAGDIVNWMD